MSGHVVVVRRQPIVDVDLTISSDVQSIATSDIKGFSFHTIHT
jgi:hypothetical protein